MSLKSRAAQRRRNDASPARETHSSLTNGWLFGVILVAIVAVTYTPVWWAGFVWDDSINITTNPCIVGPQGLWEIWTTTAAQFYPLALTTIWFEHALWGLNPLPYHLINVLMHGACAVVLWLVLRSLLVPGAWLGAALWAVHPVQVESVAWVTEIKNTQSTLFYLLSILFFVRHLKSPYAVKSISWDRNYAMVLLFAVLAIASKSSTVVLPPVLCLCAWWVEGRWQWRNLVKVAPLFLVAVAACALTIWTQVLSLTTSPLDVPWAHTWQGHLAAVGEGFWFYLAKVIWPHPLMVSYPQMNIDTGNPLSYLPTLGLLVALFILWRKRESWARPYFFAFAYFLVALLPELEFAGWYIGDHFEYLACMGPLALAGAGLARLADFAPLRKRRLQSIPEAAVILLLGALSWCHAWPFQNEETLWTDEMTQNPACWMAYYNLGCFYKDEGRIGEAKDYFLAAIRVEPRCYTAHTSLGWILAKEGRTDDAIAEYQKSLEIFPGFLEAQDDLALASLDQGRSDVALVELRNLVKADPDSAKVHNDLGYALARNGQLDDAVAEYQTALKLMANYPEPLLNWANLLVQKGQLDAAMEMYEKCLAIKPDYTEALNNMGIVLLRKGDFAGAAEKFQKVLQVNPGDETVHENLGLALLRQGAFPQAAAEFAEVVRQKPGDVNAFNNLGMACLQFGNLDLAIDAFRKGLTIAPNSDVLHFNLGTALAQQGKADEAMAEFKRTLQLNPKYPGVVDAVAKIRGTRH